MAPEIDRLYLYDNSIDDQDASLVLRASAGDVERRYMRALEWMAPIIDRLEADGAEGGGGS